MKKEYIPRNREFYFHEVGWDYSNQLFNIDGRICMLSLLIFAYLVNLIIYIIAPFINKKLKTIKIEKLIILSLILVFSFSIVAYSSIETLIMESSTSILIINI